MNDAGLPPEADELRETIAEMAADLVPGTVLKRSRRDTAIIVMSARGDKVKDIAKAVGAGVRTMKQVRSRHAAPLDKLQDIFRRMTLSHGFERLSEMATSLLDSACDTTNKNQAQCARTFGELSGISGKSHVHIGDHIENVSQTSIHAENVQAILSADPSELRAQLDADSASARDRLNGAPPSPAPADAALPQAAADRAPSLRGREGLGAGVFALRDGVRARVFRPALRLVHREGPDAALGR